MSRDASAVSSTASEAPLSAADQAVLSGDPVAYRAARAAERAGTPLEPTNPADSAAATPEQAASTDAHESPASEPGKGKDKGAEGRKAELRAEIDDLLRQRRELRESLAQERQQTKPAESSPAPAEPTKRDIARFKSMPGYPKAEDYEDYDDLVTARADFMAEQRLNEAQQRQHAEQQAGEFAKSLDSMLTKGREAFDDFVDVLGAAEQAGIVFPPDVARKMLTHEQGHVIARELAQRAISDPAFRAVLADPVETAIVVGQILAAQSAPKASPVSVSKAPEPPVTLGRKPSAVLDPLEAAVREGDTEAYLAAKRAQRAAAAR